jgi:uncharacterized protein YkwD
MLKRLPKLRLKGRKDKKPSDIITGTGSGPLKKYKFSKFHAIAMVVVFMAGGYVLVRSYASSSCSRVCVILPEYDYTKTDDFHIRTQVRFPSDTSFYNVKVVLDRGTTNEQVVDIRRNSSYIRAGSYPKDYNFYFGNLASGNSTTEVFDRQLLTPGRHTITAEMRNGDVPGQGTFIGEDTNSFLVQNIKNLQTSRDPAKTYYIKQLPLSGNSFPRSALNTEDQESRATLAVFLENSLLRTSDILADLKKSVFDTPKASAHTSTGTNHGTLRAIVYVDDPYGGSTNNDRRQGNVTVYADIRTDRGTNCHNTANPNKRESTQSYNGYNYYRIAGETDATQGDNHGVIHFYDCPTSAGYNYNVGFIMPGGYHIHPDSAQVKTISLEYTGANVEFTIRPNDDDGDGTPNYRDNCPSQSGPNSNGGCPINEACRGPAANVQRNIRTPLKRFWSGNWTDHLYQLPVMDNNGLNAGYCYERDEGWVYSNQVPGTVPLYRFWHGGQTDHFYSQSYSEGVNAGYAYEGVSGYVANYQQPGTVPLYRFWRGDIYDHFYGTNYWEGVNAGYAYEGVAGYVWTGYGSAYHYEPSNPPLLSMTTLSANRADVNIFGLGMDDNGFPGLKTLNWVWAKVDGATTDSHSIGGRANNTLIGEPIWLGNLADGRYHTVEIFANTYNGQTAYMKFYTDPYGPYSATLSSSMTANSSDYFADISTATSRYGNLKVKTIENNNENDAKFTNIKNLPNVFLKVKNVNNNYKCTNGDGIKTSGGDSSYTFGSCPLGTKGPKYRKTYLISATVPNGYHVDKNFLKTKGVTKQKQADGSVVITRKIVIDIRHTTTNPKSIRMVFVKNSSQFPDPGAPTSAPVNNFPPGPEDALYTPAEEDELLKYMNDERAARGIRLLYKEDFSRDTRRRTTARAHLEDMISNNYFAHVSLAPECTNVGERSKSNNVGLEDSPNPDTAKIGENLAVGSSYLGTPWGLMYGTQGPQYGKGGPGGLWNSPGHRANILDPAYLYVGVATHKNISNYTARKLNQDSSGEYICNSFMDNPTYFASDTTLNVVTFYSF